MYSVWFQFYDAHTYTKRKVCKASYPMFVVVISRLYNLR